MILKAVPAASPEPRRAWQTITNRAPTDYAEALTRSLMRWLVSSGLLSSLDAT